jgi:hypothetical protein
MTLYYTVQSLSFLMLGEPLHQLTWPYVLSIYTHIDNALTKT